MDCRSGSVQETESIPLTEYCRAFLDSVSQGAAVEQRLEAGIGVFRVRRIEEGLVSFIDLGHVNRAIISKMMPPVATFQIADRKIGSPAL